MSTVSQSQTGQKEINIRKLGRAALLAGLIAAVGNLVVYFIAQGALGLSLMVTAPGSTELTAVLPVQIVLASIVPAFGAAVLLALLMRFVKRPVRIFQIIGVIFLLASFGGPLNLPVPTSTIVTLELMHVVAGATIIWILSRNS